MAERTAAAPTPIIIDIPEEPALKRYRQLFEGTERAASSLDVADGGSSVIGPTQTLTATDTARKRKSADRDGDEDVDTEGPTRLKRRVPNSGLSQKSNRLGQEPSYTEPNLESSQSQSTTQSHAPPAGQIHTRALGSRGAVPGAPDKDTALLNALAQNEKEQASASKTEKSKEKKAGLTDKDFSDMRIAEEKEKEEASRRRAEEMRIWEECERDVNVRGNFMVVELVDLVRRNRGSATRSVNPAWEGKPDFKKFKKACNQFSRLVH